MRAAVAMELNGNTVSLEVEPHRTLLDLLRDTLGETGTKEGCGEGECGACTVLVDDRAVVACLYPVCEADGKRVTTVEGLLEPGGRLSAVQRSYLDFGGAQCGFCTPGMVMATVALLAEHPDPSDDEIRYALTGNLCRCTGYVQIVEAIRAAAETLAEEAAT
ncbi:MAG: (2Fe-2S)-binding protein [Acidimicrobiia bacterium]